MKFVARAALIMLMNAVSIAFVSPQQNIFLNQTANIISGLYFREPPNAVFENAPQGIANAEGYANISFSTSRTKTKSKPRDMTLKDGYTRHSVPKRNADFNGAARNSWTNFRFNKSSFTYKEGDYLLGYSGNPFGSHNGFLERMTREAPYYVSHMRSRKKRSVFHLYNMVLCATGCNPLSYKGYGCYCGFLGSGYVVDGIDSCCKMHDWCYNTSRCPVFLEYFIPYLWKCYHHQYPLCAMDHGEFGGPGSCAQRLCECDRRLAQCLKMYPCPGNKALCTSSPWRLLQNLFMI